MLPDTLNQNFDKQNLLKDIEEIKNNEENNNKEIKEILEDRVKDEDYFVYYQFHANELKKGIWGNQMQNIIEREKEQRQQRTEKLKEKIIAEMKPFSFYEKR